MTEVEISLYVTEENELVIEFLDSAANETFVTQFNAQDAQELLSAVAECVKLQKERNQKGDLKWKSTQTTRYKSPSLQTPKKKQSH